MTKTLLQRLWLLVITFGCTLGLSAQNITSLAEIVSGEYYRIVNVQSGRALSATATGTAVTQLDVDRTSHYQRWQLTKDDATGLYTFTNEGKEQSIVKAGTTNGSAITMGTTAGLFTIRKTTVTTSNDTYFNILPEGSTSPAFNNYSNAGGDVKLWDANAGGEWTIQPFPQSEFEDAAFLDKSVFRIVNRRSSTLYITDVTNSGSNSGKLLGQAKNTANYSQVWLLQPLSNGGYTFLNLESGRKVSTDGKSFVTTTGAGAPYYITKSTNNVGSGQAYWNIATAASFESTSKEEAFNQYPNGEFQVGTWTFTGDQGSDWQFIPVDSTEISRQAIRERIDRIAGNDTIVAGKYYYIQNYSTGRVIQENYLNASGSVSTTGLLISGEKSEGANSQIWQATAGTNGKFGFKNIASGRRIKGAAANTQVTTSSAIYNYTVKPNEEYRFETVYDIMYNLKQGLNNNSSNIIIGSDISDNKPNHAASEWVLREVVVTDSLLEAAKQEFADFKDAKQNSAKYATLLNTYFDDLACTKLKAEYAAMPDEALKAEVDTTLNATLAEMVMKVKTDKWHAYPSGNNWEKLFRIRSYGAYSVLGDMANALVLNAWSRVNNPTGISSGTTNTPIYVFVDDYTMPAGGQLYAEFLPDVYTNNDASRVTLKKGLNVLSSTTPNVPLFFFYETKAGDPIAKYAPITIHVEGGDVNGFFDATKQTDADWQAMLSDGLFQKTFGIDVLGERVMWHMNAKSVIDITQGQPVRVMKQWDRVVELEAGVMGIIKTDAFDDPAENLYPSVYNNRMAAISATKNYMWSSWGGTYYNENTLPSVLNYDNMNGTGALWGPAHEIGHNNQTAIKLVGTTEVSNNLLSNIVVWEFGKITTRYWGLQGRQEAMNTAWPAFYNYRSSNVGEPIAQMNRMFFTLYLYYHVLGNKPDFYQKVFKKLRHDRLIQAGRGATPVEDITYASNDYLKFAMACCDAAEEDLSEYFDVWGFFKPCDEQIGDYSNYRIVNDEKQVAAWKEALKAKGYRKNGNIVFLDDRAEVCYQADGVTPRGAMEGYTVANCENKLGTFSAFKANAKPVNYTARILSTGTVTISGANRSGAVGFKVYDKDGNLVYVAFANSSFKLPSWIPASDYTSCCVVAAAADPANDVVIYGTLTGIDNVTTDEAKENVIYDLSGRRVQQASKGLYIVNGKKVLVK